MPLKGKSMKKAIDSKSSHDNQFITEDNYQELIVEIINTLVEKKKSIHFRYDQLIKKLYDSPKPTRIRALLSKYLLTRLMRESDRAFNEAQLIAKNFVQLAKKTFRITKIIQIRYIKIHIKN